MPKYGPHLVGIEKQVHDRIAQLGLKPSYIFSDKLHQERFYTAPCKDSQGNKVVFKMRTENFEETKVYFRREIGINRLFTRHFNPESKLSVPKFIAGDSEHEPEWMVYEFIEGFETGDFYNGFETGNIKNFSVPDLIADMRNMQEMSTFAEGEIALEKKTATEFRVTFARYSERLEPFFADFEIARAADVLKSGTELLDRGCATISHGDFHPGNIIITKTGGVAIIDWYNVHLNNAAFDIAFLVLEIPERKFRDKVLELFLKELVPDHSEFWALFRLNILRLVPQKINVLYDALYTEHPTVDDYATKLTPKGRAKLEANLDFFTRALKGEDFL